MKRIYCTPTTVLILRIPQPTLIYQLISSLLVFPVYRILFRGYTIGQSNVPSEGPLVVVSNHGSDLDPPLLGHILSRPIAFMAKVELFTIPLLRSLIRACGAYPVRRGSNDREAIRIAKARLTDGWAIGIFPDGTRQVNGRVDKAQLGAALLSFYTGAPLLPVAIVNSHRAMGRHQNFPRFLPIQIYIGNPIAPPISRHRKHLEATTQACKDQINLLLDRGLSLVNSSNPN
ncbi:1-acyl-sn-glycerol-3-phosphate acyltransferase (chromatophore) [Paulinella micropora]|uniref:1-acyl-sn-glycerol-3-phosphate acyltransferase n=1 Tax=Paulinella micropora TaxID=1928728 RepID=A0A1S6YHR2_9EUKA|nr:1-acyl-sn-glycerol-3-phosphate acyltransferase [Paulinella micropora]BBL86074.1 1-acyl-sn-glycerol-3-phosphate acyltransferase [Paulinella micropora]